MCSLSRLFVFQFLLTAISFIYSQMIGLIFFHGEWREKYCHMNDDSEGPGQPELCSVPETESLAIIMIPIPTMAARQRAEMLIPILFR